MLALISSIIASIQLNLAIIDTNRIYCIFKFTSLNIEVRLETLGAKLKCIYTGLSRKVVGKKCKSARDNPERYCGYFQGILRKWLVTPWTCVCGS